jgi:acetyl-CoA carboxylase beta subunit
LSRQPDHYREDAQDNQNVVVLQPAHFRVAAAQRGHAVVDDEKEILAEIRNESKELLNSLTQIVKIGPRRISQGLTDWETEDGLVLY